MSLILQILGRWPHNDLKEILAKKKRRTEVLLFRTKI